MVTLRIGQFRAEPVACLNVLAPRALRIGGCLAAVLVSPSLAAQSSAPIQHVIVIMQENRSFDSYFATFPGADGPPSGTCIPLDIAKPASGCVAPFHDPHDTSLGGPHLAADAQYDLDDGVTKTLQDGFVEEQSHTLTRGCSGSAPAYYCNDVSELARHDVMGYHTDAEIPNYWAYATNFVLQDRMFEGVRDWSQSSHLDLVSEWSATCSDYTKTSTCVTGGVYPIPPTNPSLPWVSLFQLLDASSVSWKYYIATGSEPDCDDGELTCYPVQQGAKILSIWNPVGGFAWVKSQGAAYTTAHNPPIEQFLADLKGGTLPQVSWVIPDLAHSEHPGNSGVTAGMVYVTSLVNAVMQSQYWNSTAIFITWDDWGGFYDHVVPPLVDRNSTKNSGQGFGIRVPGLMISVYAKPGLIDHQVLSFDSYATFIEDLFANSTRLNPANFGNPDSRPDIRDALQSLAFPGGATEPVGDLMAEFDFSQTPLPPMILSTHIPINLRAACRTKAGDTTETCQVATVKLSWDMFSSVDSADKLTFHVARDGVDLPACTTSKASCVDSPGSGAHLYRAYTVDAKGVTSPQSAAVEADQP